MAKCDAGHLFFQGIYFDVGLIVATDGRRLLRCPAPSLKSLSAAILAGPWNELPPLPDSAAALVVEGEDVALEFANAPTVRLGQVSAPFPKYQRVVPKETGEAALTVRASHFNAALKVLQATSFLSSDDQMRAGWSCASQRRSAASLSLPPE